MLTDSEVATIRSRFRIFERKIYLNSCSQGALSDAVESALLENIASWHEGGSPWDLWVQKYEAARACFAAFIGGQPDEVAVVPSASAGINAIASALDFRERNTVVLGDFEFPTMGHVWLAQQPRGAQIHFVAGENNRLPAKAYERAIDRRTLVVPLTHICFMNGFRSDVAAVTRLAHDQGAWVMLDDYQDCGTRPIDVRAWGVDFYVTGTLKYLLGAPGVAFLYVRKEIIPTLTPTISGWFGQTNPFAFDVRKLDPAPSARRFEAGTPPIPNIYAAQAGLELLSGIGLGRVSAHVFKLTQALLHGARELNIVAKTPADSAGPLVVLQMKDVNAMLARLAERAIIGSARHDGLRISFHVYNTLADVEAVLYVLKQNLDLTVRQ
jgi:selenocysteine lyase/cysteine desulfurase